MRNADGEGVWITGLGAVTAAGEGTGALRRLLRDGRTALCARKDLGGLEVGCVEVPRATRATRGLDPAARLFVAAAEEAWADAGLEAAGALPGDAFDTPGPGMACVVTVVEGSSLGPLPHLIESYGQRLERLGRATAHPLDLVRFMPGAGGAAFAQAHGIPELAYQVVAGSVSGSLAIAQGAALVAGGCADVVLAGGADAPVQAEVLQAFLAAGVQAPAGEACRPFDERRAGTALADGAGVVVLESARHARARGAWPRARLLGFGAAAESYGRAAPDPDGKALLASARKALDGQAEPGWVKAHGTGTRPGDASELRGLARLFGVRLAQMPVTSLKSAVGHALGASGAVEAVAVVLSLEDGFVPGTLGFERLDPDAPACRVSACPRDTPGGSVLLLSESFGGRAAALVLAA